jgi:hypothetical protein
MLTRKVYKEAKKEQQAGAFSYKTSVLPVAVYRLSIKTF